MGKYDTPRRDYFNGVAPSDVALLNNRDLFMAAMRLEDAIASGAVGTPREQAFAAEALEEVYREKNRRKASFR